MSVLTLVRHGQASFFSDHYDQLTPLGIRQSRLLGEFWARRGVTFDQVYAGSRARQQQTAREVVEAIRAAGLVCPEPVLLDALDEYDFPGMFQHLSRALERDNADYAQLVNSYRASKGGEDVERLRRFQRMFEVLLGHWQSATTVTPVEAWPAFRDRVQRVLRQIQESAGQGKRVAAFTSGGFIGCAAQTVLAAPDRSALELNWRLKNASLTEFVFTRERFTLDSFNALPHLDSPDLWTYR